MSTLFTEAVKYFHPCASLVAALINQFAIANRGSSNGITTLIGHV